MCCCSCASSRPRRQPEKKRRAPRAARVPERRAASGGPGGGLPAHLSFWVRADRHKQRGAGIQTLVPRTRRRRSSSAENASGRAPGGRRPGPKAVGLSFCPPPPSLSLSLLLPSPEGKQRHKDRPPLGLRTRLSHSVRRLSEAPFTEVRLRPSPLLRAGCPPNREGRRTIKKAAGQKQAEEGVAVSVAPSLARLTHNHARSRLAPCARARPDCWDDG